ncbi:MAG: HEAT repeat domain-containing protein [Thermoguttaceae bacterium]|nr:HEAT repeat domain-containing protein [Thermoguttaceae bacterium]
MQYFYRSLGLFSTLLLFAAGCTSPFWATDNELFLRLPGTERRSDQVEGVLRPWERIERIAEKGEEGAKAPPEEKKILVFQLIKEYNRSQDPLVRRASIRSLGKITETAHIEPALETLLSALKEENLGNRIAAAEALGAYGSRVKSEDLTEVRQSILTAFTEAYRAQPFLSDAGSDKENNERKDFRLALLHSAPQLGDSAQMIDFLAEAMQDEPLDDGALRLAAMSAMSKATRKNYGADYRLWSDYVAYRRGKRSDPPKEISGLRSALNLNDSALLK